MSKNIDLIKTVQNELDKTIHKLTVLKMLYGKARTNHEKIVLLKAVAELQHKKKLLNDKLIDYICL